jgi:hypothetical protein
VRNIGVLAILNRFSRVDLRDAGMPSDDGLIPVRAFLSTIAAHAVCAKVKTSKGKFCGSGLAYSSAVAIARKIRQRKPSSRETVDYFLTRVEVLDKRINSVVTIDAERARTASRARK